MAQTLVPISAALLQGTVHCNEDKSGLHPWRFPPERLVLINNDGFSKAARAGAGVRLRFHTDASALTLHYEGHGEDQRFDLVAAGEILQKAKGSQSEVAFSLEGGEMTYEIWLPPKGDVTLKTLELTDANTFSIPSDPRPRWITYGSSITQSAGATSPALTWPAIVARENNLHLTCLGFSGQCHLDPAVAEVIATTPADVVTLKIGININNQGSLNLRTFRPAMAHLVERVRRSHPSIPIGLVTSIHAPGREKQPNQHDILLEDYRNEVRAVHGILQGWGDAQLHLFEGPDLLGPDHTDHFPDGLHPNGLGYQLLGDAFSKTVMKPLLQSIKA